MNEKLYQTMLTTQMINFKLFGKKIVLSKSEII